MPESVPSHWISDSAPAVRALDRETDWFRCQLCGSADQTGCVRQRSPWRIVIRSEVIRLYLPRTLIELANHQTQQPPLQTHEELRRSLEARHHRDLWYALTVRGFQVNGEFADTTFIRRPYAEPDRFAEFLEIMAAATVSPLDLGKNLSSATVHLIPDELSERDPREVITELIGQSPPPTMSDSPPR